MDTAQARLTRALAGTLRASPHTKRILATACGVRSVRTKLSRASVQADAVRRNATQSLPPVVVTILGSGTMQWLGDREDRVILRCGAPPVSADLTSPLTPPADVCSAH